MGNQKHLVSLDEDCCGIIKNQYNKSEYIRKAIKFFNKNENNESSKVIESGLKRTVDENGVIVEQIS